MPEPLRRTLLLSLVVVSVGCLPPRPRISGPPPSGTMQLGRTGASKKFKLAYVPYEGTSWLRSRLALTTTTTIGSEPPVVRKASATALARVRALGKRDGLLRYEGEVTEATTTNEDGTTTAQKTFPGLKRLVGRQPGTGAWGELTWSVPPGMTKEELDAARDLFHVTPQLVLPDLDVGAGAEWSYAGTQYSTDLRTERQVNETTSVTEIGSGGAKLVNVIYQPLPDRSSSDGELTNGRRTINTTATVEGGRLPERLERTTTEIHDLKTKSGVQGTVKSELTLSMQMEYRK